MNAKSRFDTSDHRKQIADCRHDGIHVEVRVIAIDNEVLFCRHHSKKYLPADRFSELFGSASGLSARVLRAHVAGVEDAGGEFVRGGGDVGGGGGLAGDAAGVGDDLGVWGKVG